jgi:Ca-activated chloride channel family protein
MLRLLDAIRTRAQVVAIVAALVCVWAPLGARFPRASSGLSPGFAEDRPAGAFDFARGTQSAQQAPTGPVQSFRVGIDVVSLSVTVTDGDNHYVSDLTANDFSVFEDGVKQDVTFFDHGNTPIALALLLDTSASMEEKLKTAQEAAIGFARRLRPQDLAELVDFDTHVQILQPFTNQPALLEQAIRKTTADGSTSLYNAVYIALQEMKKIRAKTAGDIRRQAIVVMSDGEDTSSLLSFDEVLDQAKRSETAIYAIGTHSAADETVSARQFNEADFVLRELSQQTGGRLFFPKRVEDLPGVYSQISDELASQYLLGYTSKNPRRDGSWRRVVVRTNRAGATARTKQGYFGPAAR